MFIAIKTIVYDLTGIHEHKNNPNDICTAFQVGPEPFTPMPRHATTTATTSQLQAGGDDTRTGFFLSF